MRTFFLASILVLLAFWLANKNYRVLFFYGFVLLTVTLRFAAEKIFPFQGSQVISDFLRMGGLFFVILTAILRKEELLQQRLFWVASACVFFFFLLGTERSLAREYMSLYLSAISICFFMLIIFAFKNCAQIKVTKESVISFTVCIGLLQCFLGVLQISLPSHLTNDIVLPRYTGNSLNDIEIKLSDLEIGSIIQGTLNRYNVYGSFQAYVFLLHFGFKKYYIRKYKFVDAVISLLLLTSVFLSGNRASLMSLIGAFLVLLFFYQRRIFFGLSLILLTFFISANVFIDKIISSGAQSSTDPIERLMTSMVIFKGERAIEESRSTLLISYSLIPDFLDNYVFGAGSYFKKGYELIGYTHGASISDATIMTILTEFGVIGAIFFFAPFLVIYRWVRKTFADSPEYYIFVSIMVMFSLQTITDWGILGRDATYFFALVLFSFHLDNTRKKRVSVIRSFNHSNHVI